MNKLVSVIVPTYNGEKFIAQTLESIINQDYENLEIIVVDDVSTDNTVSLVREILENSGRKFQLIQRTVNGRQSASRNTGLDAANGEYVMFFDHDDLAEKNFVSSLYKEAEDKQADFMNPNMMTDMLTRNISNAIYYISLFVVGGFFFSGYILLKLPFGLTRTFKSMMQQGLSLPDFDPSYVSAISWCLILVFGINPILQFFDGGEDFSMFTQQKQMMTQPLNLMGNPMAGKNYEKILKPEKESINIVSNFSLLDDAVDTLIDRYKL